MEPLYKHRLELLITLLVVGIVAGAAIVVIGAENALPGTSNGYISVVNPPQRSQSPEQQAQRHVHYEARVKSLLAIALKDERVQALLAGKNYTVVGIVFPRPPPPLPGAAAGTTARSNTSSPLLSPSAPPHSPSAPPHSPGARPIENASLVLRVEGKFYQIDIDILHEKVTSVAQRNCYGPACNG
ncbi:MAG TPA: hypothetical protein VEF35_03795 [Candidatus Bathyarchaeia archaeon]|nr:hypothetical protein [Candidatus Bathyarchaeia archaeon]